MELKFSTQYIYSGSSGAAGGGRGNSLLDFRLIAALAECASLSR